MLVSINCPLNKAATEELLVSDRPVGLSVGMVLSINWCGKTQQNGCGTIPGGKGGPDVFKKASYM